MGGSNEPCPKYAPRMLIWDEEVLVNFVLQSSKGREDNPQSRKKNSCCNQKLKA